MVLWYHQLSLNWLSTCVNWIFSRLISALATNGFTWALRQNKQYSWLILFLRLDQDNSSGRIKTIPPTESWRFLRGQIIPPNTMINDHQSTTITLLRLIRWSITTIVDYYDRSRFFYLYYDANLRALGPGYDHRNQSASPQLRNHWITRCRKFRRGSQAQGQDQGQGARPEEVKCETVKNKIFHENEKSRRKRASQA